jgi:hypothetical protein
LEGDRLRIPADEHQRQWPAKRFVWASLLKKVDRPSGLADNFFILEPFLEWRSSRRNTEQYGSLPTRARRVKSKVRLWQMRGPSPFWTKIVINESGSRKK